MLCWRMEPWASRRTYPAAVRDSLQMHIGPAPQAACILPAAAQTAMLPWSCNKHCWPAPHSRSSTADLLHCRGINKEARDKMQGGHNIFSNDVESRPAGKAGVKVRGHRVPRMHLSTNWGSAAHVLPVPACLSGVQLFTFCLHLCHQATGQETCVWASLGQMHAVFACLLGGLYTARGAVCGLPEAALECVHLSKDMASKPARKAGDDLCGPLEHTCSLAQGAAQLGPTTPALLAGAPCLLSAGRRCHIHPRDCLYPLHAPWSWAPFLAC